MGVDCANGASCYAKHFVNLESLPTAVGVGRCAQRHHSFEGAMHACLQDTSCGGVTQDGGLKCRTYNMSLCARRFGRLRCDSGFQPAPVRMPQFELRAAKRVAGSSFSSKANGRRPSWILSNRNSPCCRAFTPQRPLDMQEVGANEVEETARRIPATFHRESALRASLGSAPGHTAAGKAWACLLLLRTSSSVRTANDAVRCLIESGET